MTFLVGNDFLPHLPSLDISEGAFDRLFAVYREQLMTAAQNDASANVASAYLTHNGRIWIHLSFFLGGGGGLKQHL